MAQSWRNGRTRDARPLDPAALERIALRYVERYATSRAKLRAYLQRKLKERGWAGENEPPVALIAERFAECGYIDDQGFAVSRAASLSRRGYGPRRVAVALKAAGIAESDAEQAETLVRAEAWSAALAFARRKRLGPYAHEAADRPAREKALAAMLRAGHGLDMARRILSAAPGTVPEPDDG